MHVKYQHEALISLWWAVSSAISPERIYQYSLYTGRRRLEHVPKYQMANAIRLGPKRMGDRSALSNPQPPHHACLSSNTWFHSTQLPQTAYYHDGLPSTIWQDLLLLIIIKNSHMSSMIYIIYNKESISALFDINRSPSLSKRPHQPT